jgi:hypothetical protein
MGGLDLLEQPGRKRVFSILLSGSQGIREPEVFPRWIHPSKCSETGRSIHERTERMIGAQRQG